MHAKLAGETRGEIHFSRDAPNIANGWQRIETRVYKVQRTAYSATTTTVSTVSHSKPRCHANMKHWTRQHALLVQKDFLPLFHPKPNGCLRFDLESCNLMHILLLPTHVTFHRSLRLAS